MPTTSNFGWTTPADTDLVKDGAAAIRTLGNGIDTSLVDLKGGTTGQILSKNSNTDLDYTWINNDQGDITEVQAGTGISVASGTGPVPVVTNTVATTFDAKGDLVVGTGADTFAKLTVGTNGHTLVADSGAGGGSVGLKWAVDPVADIVTTAGDILYATAADTLTRLGIGTAGQVLKVNSGATAPEWGAAASSNTMVGCVVYNSANQNVSNATDVYPTFDSERFDSDGFHSTSSNTSRLTVPSGKGGYYFIFANQTFDANSTGYRKLMFVKNRTGVEYGVMEYTPGGQSCGMNCVFLLNLAAGDYIECKVYQNSGGTRSIFGGEAFGFGMWKVAD